MATFLLNKEATGSKVGKILSSYKIANSLAGLIIIGILTACTSNDSIGKNLAALASQSSLNLGSSGTPNGLVITPTPTPTPPDPPTTGLVFNKSPTASGAPQNYFGLNGPATPSSEINFDAFLIRVPLTETTAGRLRNADIKVSAQPFDNGFAQPPSTQEAKANAQGNWDFSSAGDSTHSLGQVMAFYWLTQEKNLALSKLAHSWGAAGRDLPIYSYAYEATFMLQNSNLPYDPQTNPKVGLNALCVFGTHPNVFLNDETTPTNYIYLGVNGPMQSAYDASVYAHEMGHANIGFGSNFAIYQGDTHTVSCPASLGSNRCCDTSDGCGLAINEGQADYHAFMTFNSPRLGEFFMGNVAGLAERDAVQNTNLTAAARFNQGGFGQEAHWMGAVWSASLWTMRQNLGADVADKLFLLHIQKLTGKDTFGTALSQIVRADADLRNQGVYTQDHTQAILASFAQHGITPK